MSVTVRQLIEKLEKIEDKEELIRASFFQDENAYDITLKVGTDSIMCLGKNTNEEEYGMIYP